MGMVEKRNAFEIGTEEWLTDTGGRLTIAQAVVMSAQGLTQAVSARFNARRPTPSEAAGQSARIAMARNKLESMLTTQRARVIERQGQPVLNHACRTYVLGAALVSDDIFERVDHTAAAVAALTHDDGLIHPSTPGNCFTSDSAVEADIMMTQLGQPKDAADVSRAAVIAHFQPRLPSNAGPDAQLVSLGASADAMGFGLRRIDRDLLIEIWHEWPDLGFLPDLKKLLIRERARAPRTRPGVLSYSGMPSLLRSGR